MKNSNVQQFSKDLRKYLARQNFLLQEGKKYTLIREDKPIVVLVTWIEVQEKKTLIHWTSANNELYGVTLKECFISDLEELR